MMASPIQNEFHQELSQYVQAETLYQVILSSPKSKGDDIAKKIIVRPVQLKNGLHYQFESYYTNKVLHQNVSINEVVEKLTELMTTQYKQSAIKTKHLLLHVLANKKGQLTIKRQTVSGVVDEAPRTHNRQKRRVLEEGKPVSFLIELGIMTVDGKVHAKKQDKFKQINRFLEMVEDVLDDLPKDRTINIVDFGCGKSYLTFALYHYLMIEQKRSIQVVGLDLKENVIEICNKLAQKLQYDELKFYVGDIGQFDQLSAVDMVVTLHACDTATDAAIEKAVSWGASVIMTVPCCQHELFPQVKSDKLAPILTQGLLKERFSALATDGIRGQLLEVIGYKVQMLEFIDPEHTPKNLMIRAVRGKALSFNKTKWAEYETFKSLLSVEHSLEKMLQPIITNMKKM